MTNEQIIFMERVRLMNEGIIGKTGRVFEIKDSAGNVSTVEEPEELHTFKMWKDKGFAVKKGEHAIAKITIWKAKERKETEDGEEDLRMFMKTAAFFSKAQVERRGNNEA